MPFKYLEDEQGIKLKVRDIDGNFTHPWEIPDEEFRSIRSWNARDNDVLICAYPKSGTHWLFETLHMLQTQNAKRVKEAKQATMLDSITQQQFDQLKSPRVLNCHSLFHQLPEDFIKRKGKIVHIVRNPKDVAVSFFHHHKNLAVYEYTGNWNDYVPRFLNGNGMVFLCRVTIIGYNSWFDYTLAWEKTMIDNQDYPIHLMSYEDLKEDPNVETAKLASFLGVSTEPSFISDVVKLCSFDSMKSDKDPRKVFELTENSPGVYRKGIVGDWKNMFTVTQSEMFNDYFKSRMKDSKLKFRFSLA